MGACLLWRKARELCLLSWRRLRWRWAELSVCEPLETGATQGSSRLSSVVPSAWSRGHGHQLKRRRVPLNTRKHCFTVAGIPEGAQGGGAVSLFPWLELTLLEPGVGWKRWPPEVLSSLLQSVILWTSVEVYPNSSDAEGLWECKIGNWRWLKMHFLNRELNGGGVGQEGEKSN